MRFEVLMAVKMSMLVFQVVMPYGLLKCWYLSTSPCSITTQKINIDRLMDGLQLSKYAVILIQFREVIHISYGRNFCIVEVVNNVFNMVTLCCSISYVAGRWLIFVVFPNYSYDTLTVAELLISVFFTLCSYPMCLLNGLYSGLGIILKKKIRFCVMTLWAKSYTSLTFVQPVIAF
jgi:hypothetical protein